MRQYYNEGERNLSLAPPFRMLNFPMKVQCKNCNKTFCSLNNFVHRSSWNKKASAKNWRKYFMAFQCQDCDTRFLFTLILFLTFHEASVKNCKKSLMAFQCPDCDTFGSYIDFALNFSWSFRKKWKKSWMAFQCPDCDTTFGYYVDLVLDFSWSFSKTTGRKLQWYFNANTVIQCFLLTLILFLTFNETSAKKLTTWQAKIRRNYGAWFFPAFVLGMVSPYQWFLLIGLVCF